MPRLEDAKNFTESDGYLHLDFGNGGTKKLKISDLPESTVEHIRSVIKGRQAAHEALANVPDGDGVTRAAEGAEIPDDLPVEPGVGELIQQPVIDPGAMSAVDALPSPEATPMEPSAGSRFLQALAPGLPPIAAGDLTMPAADIVKSANDVVASQAKAREQQGNEDAAQRQASLESSGLLPKGDAVSTQPGAPIVVPRDALSSPPAAATPTPTPGASPRAAPRGGGSSATPFASEKEYAAVQEQKQQNALDQAKLEADRLERSAQMRADLQKDMDGIHADYVRDRDANRREQALALQEYRNTKVDPGNLWANASTGSKIAAGIGMILGGIGSGLTGQPNLAVKIVNDAIDRDIDAQKMKIAQNKETLALLRQQGLDIDDFFDRKKADAKEQVAAKILQDAEKTGSAKALAEGRAASLALAGEGLAARDARAQRRANQRMKESALAMQQRVANSEIQHRQLMDMLAIGKAGETKGPAVQWVDGRTYAAADEDAAKKAREVTQNFAVIEDALGKMKTIRGEYGREATPFTQGAKDAKFQQRRVQLALKEIARLGAWDEGSANILGDMVPDITSVGLSDDGAMEAIDRLRNDALTRLNAASRSYLKAGPAAVSGVRRAGQ